MLQREKREEKVWLLYLGEVPRQESLQPGFSEALVFATFRVFCSSAGLALALGFQKFFPPSAAIHASVLLSFLCLLAVLALACAFCSLIPVGLRRAWGLCRGWKDTGGHHHWLVLCRPLGVVCAMMLCGFSWLEN